jgi:uncharacterized small protein (DUF1192 family)
MDWDEPVNKPAKKQLADLDVMSIEALHEYIDELKGEIARAEAKIADKQAARSGAESFFKS